MTIRDFPAVKQSREAVYKQFEHYRNMMNEHGIIKTPQVTQPFADSYFPVYTYRYDEHTNILTQYKNGVEYMRMFVPEPYELKESL